MNGFGQASTAAPWGGLPTAQQPWSGGSQWQAAQQAPWRMSPFQTQGMPSGAAVQAPPTQGAQLPAGYLPQGTSQSLPDFQPQQAGGGFYPNLLGGQQQQQQQQPALPQQQSFGYEMVRDPWYGKATGAGFVDDPLGGYSLQRKGNDYHWQDVPFIERVRQQGLI